MAEAAGEAAAEAVRRSEPAGAALALEGVSSGYGAVSIVKGVSLSVAPGEIVALLGKNGMGKTTLLKTILGMVALRGGAITVGGQALAGLSPARLVALGVGYAPQEQPCSRTCRSATTCASRSPPTGCCRRRWSGCSVISRS